MDEGTTTPRQRYLQRHSGLRTNRAHWDTHWRELAQFVRPRSYRFFSKSDAQNAGDKKHQHIINGTAGRALRILASGMMAGVTSPARQWFRLTTADPDLAEAGAVTEWLEAVSRRMLWAFGKSNIYNVLSGLYPDLGLIGTAPILVEEDKQSIVWACPVPVGEYCLALDGRLRTSTLYREVSLTVEQLAENFGLAKCSEVVRRLYQQNKLDEQVEVLHVIEPRRNPGGMPGPKGMAWASVWMEKAGDAATGFLRQSGYEERPFMAPRWEVTGTDVYGSSPGMAALGDIKALQLYEKWKALGVEKIVDPPTVAPSELENQAFSLAPGAVNYMASTAGMEVKPAISVHPAVISATTEAIREHEQRINGEFYADLWLMMSEGADDPQKTAREISERHEEKMLQLGPVMERLEAELLNPLVERVFRILLRNGYLPPPPRELQGQDLRVEYLSIMTQAQKMITGQSLQQQAAFVLQFAQVRPDALDKINLDEMIAGHAEALGLEAKYTVPEDQVQQLRQQRAQVAQQQAAMEQAAQGAQAAKALSQADTGGDNLLARVVGGPAAAEAGGVQ